MDASKNLYNKQKGLKGYDDLNKYSDIIRIKEVSQTANIIRLKDINGKEYSHLIKLENSGWEENLMPGNNVAVFVIERRVNGKVYFNIYPDRFCSKVVVPDEELE
jgi:hypothetical protein